MANIERIDPPSPTAVVALILLCWIGAFSLRLFAPSNLVENDQLRPSSYVLDAARNGNWISQRDASGDITSKPPLYTWAAAGATLFAPRISLFTLYLPTALSVFGVALLLLHWGSRVMNVRTGTIAALIWMLSVVGIKQICHARTDGLFGLTVFATALLTYRAAQTGRGRFGAWAVASASVLTKGPLGLLLVAGGLAFGSRIGGGRRRSLRRAFSGPGLLFLLAVVVGWFAAAYWVQGQDLVDKMLGRELIGHVVADGKGRLPLQNLHKPLLYFLSRFAPWSPLAVVGIWRVFRRPARRPAERRFERAMTGYFLFGLVLFSIAPHQRPDHLVPLVPAAALLAGRELARFSAGWSARRFVGASGVACALLLALASLWFVRLRADSEAVLQTSAIRSAAVEIEARIGYGAPLEECDTHLGLQFFLDRMRLWISRDEAEERLREGTTMLAVSGRVREQLIEALGPEGVETVVSAADRADIYVVRNPNAPPPASPRPSPSADPLRVTLGLGLLAALVLGPTERIRRRLVRDLHRSRNSG